MRPSWLEKEPTRNLYFLNQYSWFMAKIPFVAAWKIESNSLLLCASEDWEGRAEGRAQAVNMICDCATLITLENVPTS